LQFFRFFPEKNKKIRKKQAEERRVLLIAIHKTSYRTINNPHKTIKLTIKLLKYNGFKFYIPPHKTGIKLVSNTYKTGHTH
jgi:hypothetical protein